MAPNRETQTLNIVSNYTNTSAAATTTTTTDHQNTHKPSRLSMETLQRTISDISSELSKETINTKPLLPPISDVEDAKCECCGLCEECTPEYIKRLRDKFSGKLVCGLCAEAVNQEMEKNGGNKEEALKEHMNACVRFNRIGREYPVLYQAEAMREILKKSSSISNNNRANSISPRDMSGQRKVGIARSSSCIPAITRETTGARRNMAN